MKTDALVRALAQDAGRRVPSVNRLVGAAMLAGSIVSLLTFALTLTPRPDLAVALESPGFCLKVGAAACLLLAAVRLLDVLARPTPPRRTLRPLAAAPLLLLAGIAIELALVPSGAWLPRLVGRSAPHCLLTIPLLSATPAAFLLLALRRAAPSNPALAGAVAGLAAGALGAMLYALSCPDDSPLFVACWYSMAVIAVAFTCLLAGRRWLTW